MFIVYESDNLKLHRTDMFFLPRGKRVASTGLMVLQLCPINMPRLRRSGLCAGANAKQDI